MVVVGIVIDYDVLRVLLSVTLLSLVVLLFPMGGCVDIGVYVVGVVYADCDGGVGVGCVAVVVMYVVVVVTRGDGVVAVVATDECTGVVVVLMWLVLVWLRVSLMLSLLVVVAMMSMLSLLFVVVVLLVVLVLVVVIALLSVLSVLLL